MMFLGDATPGDVLVLGEVPSGGARAGDAVLGEVV